MVKLILNIILCCVSLCGIKYGNTPVIWSIVFMIAAMENCYLIVEGKKDE